MSTTAGAAAVRAALALAGGGRVFDLSQPISADSPRMGGMLPYSFQLRLAAASDQPGSLGWNGETVTMDLHTGTHIDALGHVMAPGGRMRELGIERLPPLVAPGLLVDAVALRGRPLEGGELITAADLENAVARQGATVQPGSVVLIRTGWSRWYGRDNPLYVSTEPGIGLTGARWLAERGAVAVGADTMALDVLPLESEADIYPAHRHLLAEAGVYIIENAMLEDLAQAGVSEFLCLCLAAPFVGATAAPIRLAGIA